MFFPCVSIVWWIIDKASKGEFTNELGALIGMFICIVFAIVYVVVFAFYPDLNWVEFTGLNKVIGANFENIVMLICSCLLVGIIFASWWIYQSNREQCPECGSFKTDEICSGHGGAHREGYSYQYAVKTYVGYHCEDCKTHFSFSLNKKV